MSVLSADGRRLLLTGVFLAGLLVFGKGLRAQGAGPVGHTEGVNCLAFAAHETLASGGLDGCIVLWDVAKRRETIVWVGDGRPVLSLAFSGDGKTLVAGTLRGLLAVWDVKEKKQVAAFQQQASFGAVAVSQDAQFIA